MKKKNLISWVGQVILVDRFLWLWENVGFFWLWHFLL